MYVRIKSSEKKYLKWDTELNVTKHPRPPPPKKKHIENLPCDPRHSGRPVSLSGEQIKYAENSNSAGTSFSNLALAGLNKLEKVDLFQPQSSTPTTKNFRKNNKENFYIEGRINLQHRARKKQQTKLESSPDDEITLLK